MRTVRHSVQTNRYWDSILLQLVLILGQSKRGNAGPVWAVGACALGTQSRSTVGRFPEQPGIDAGANDLCAVFGPRGGVVELLAGSLCRSPEQLRRHAE